MSILIKDMEKPRHCGYCRFRYDGICHALQKTRYSMDECPLVEVSNPPAEKTGKWIEEHLITRELVYCSECGFGKSLDDHRPYKYCPNCGARMEVE